MLNKSLSIILMVLLTTVVATTTSMAGSGDDGRGRGGGGDTGDVSQPTLSEGEAEGLLFMREEEKVARDSYITLGDAHGLVIFDNITVSEQKHMDAIKALMESYGLADPVEVAPVVGEFLNPDLQALYDALMLWGKQSVMDGLRVGAAIEETDIVDIQHFIDLAAQADIISTYESLMCGSRNHLRAFVRQIEANGGEYEPGDDYFEGSDGYFYDLAHTPMERDCG